MVNTTAPPLLHPPVGGRTAGLGDAEAGAWQQSCMAALPIALADMLLAGARALKLETGASLHCDGAPLDRLQPTIVVEGLLRLYQERGHGRPVTIRHAAEGDLLGIESVLAGAVPGPGRVRALARRTVQLHAEAIRDSVLLELDGDTLRSAMRTEPGVALALCRALYGDSLRTEATLIGNGAGRPQRWRASTERRRRSEP